MFRSHPASSPSCSPWWWPRADIGYQMVTVGNAGNANDPATGSLYGAVSYVYDIGTYDVTISQYCTFLNAVANSDPYGLYNTGLATDSTIAGISRSGSKGSYTYSVIGNSGQDPVTYVSWLDAARLANWMQNGQPVGLGEVAGSTEQGAYTLNGDTTSGLETKNANATYWIPSESEWYKAAYYDPTLNGGAGGYWAYATRSNTAPGNQIGNAPNEANYYTTVYSVTQVSSRSGSQNYLTPVGSFTGSASYYDTYDQSGDVFDWNDAIIDGTDRGLRGGSWYGGGSAALESTDRDESVPTVEGSGRGIRLAGLFASVGTFAATGSLNVARTSPTAILLGNGQVLAAGGSAQTTTELYDPTRGVWMVTGSLNTARVNATGVLLPSGEALVAGGYGSSDLASAELYNPATGIWTVTGSLNTARDGHVGVLLNNGQVLVAGGISPTTLNSAELYNPATGAWTFANPMNTARSFGTATLLSNGTVLVAGGKASNGAATTASEIYDPVAGTWTATNGAMNAARYYHTATLLPNGTVLVAGGTSGNSTLATAEIFNPSTGTWTLTGSMNTARDLHTASLLPSGNVFVACGVGATAEIFNYTTGVWTEAGSFSATHTQAAATIMANGKVLITGGAGIVAETYDPANGSWSSTAGSMASARSAFVEKLLPTGMVLAAGGFNGSAYLGSAELYNPSTGAWTGTASFSSAGDLQSATLLASGKVLTAGGWNGAALGNATIYDPVATTWTATGGLNTARYDHTATLLSGGSVLVAGGSTGSSPIGTAEVYNSASGIWTFTGTFVTPRYSHTATLLTNGMVLAAGGLGSSAELASAELYNPTSGTWAASGNLNTARTNHTATLLPNGKVLVTGGSVSGNPLASAEIYDPTAGTWAATGSLASARYWHTATLLPNGKVLVAGGVGAAGTLASTELYDPATGVWTVSGNLNNARAQASAVLLPTGQILVAGGTNGSSLNSSELYDPGLGFSASWQPQISSASTPLLPAGYLTLAGSGFRGIAGASGGSYTDSSTNYPLVQLRAVEGGQSVFLPSNSTTNWSASSFTSAAVSGFPYGYAMATVFTNGIPGVSALVDVAPSSNAALSNLVLSAGTLTPTFASTTMSYTANVSDTTASVTITPTVADPTASVTVNGVSVASGSPSGSINLSAGPNTINTVVTAQDGVTMDTYSVVVTQLTNLQNWRLTYFGTTANSGNAADTFDYDANGLPNLMKYAFGLDPTMAAENQIPQAILSRNSLSISFNQPAGVSGISYGAQWTSTLNPPNWQSVPDTGSGTAHIFSISIGSYPELFIRLQVTDP